MKFFKSTLSIMILFTTSSMFAARLPKGRTLAAKPTARKTPTKPAPKTTVTTTQPTTATQPQTYKMLLSKIKTMPANEVVDNAGNTLQPAFVKSVLETTPRLSQIEIEALLQAAVNMHATWSGNQAKDKAALSKLSSQIQDATSEEMEMPELVEIAVTKPAPKAVPYDKPLPSVPYDKPLPAVPYGKPLPPVPAPEFYDPTTALFKQEYLDNRVKQLLQTNTEQKTKNILEQELLTGLRREWADRGITNIVSSTKIALEQINDTVIKIVEENREKLEEAQDILRKLQTKGTSSAEKAEEALMKIKARSQTEKPASSYDRPLPALPEPTQAQLITTELAKIDNINAAFAADISVAQKAETLIPVLGALKKAYPNMSSADAAVPLMAALSEQGGAIAQWNDAGKAELKKEIEDWFNKIEVQK